jgi:hypothetical protein
MLPERGSLHTLWVTVFGIVIVVWLSCKLNGLLSKKQLPQRSNIYLGLLITATLDISLALFPTVSFNEIPSEAVVA